MVSVSSCRAHDTCKREYGQRRRVCDVRGRTHVIPSRLEEHRLEPALLDEPSDELAHAAEHLPTERDCPKCESGRLDCGDTAEKHRSRGRDKWQQPSRSAQREAGTEGEVGRRKVKASADATLRRHIRRTVQLAQFVRSGRVHRCQLPCAHITAAKNKTTTGTGRASLCVDRTSDKFEPVSTLALGRRWGEGRRKGKARRAAAAAPPGAAAS
eukprot:4936600-Pleurochrysis_carterae.AAC.4